MNINVLLKSNNNILYPKTLTELIQNSDGTKLTTTLAALRTEIDTFLSDAAISSSIKEALLELKNYLEGDGEVVSELLNKVSEAVLYSQQNISDSNKQQARVNIGAVGIHEINNTNKAAVLSYGDDPILPITDAANVLVKKDDNYITLESKLDQLTPTLITQEEYNNLSQKVEGVLYLIYE
jgi:hypothetical protein